MQLIEINISFTEPLLNSDETAVQFLKWKRALTDMFLLFFCFRNKLIQFYRDIDRQTFFLNMQKQKTLKQGDWQLFMSPMNADKDIELSGLTTPLI